MWDSVHVTPFDHKHDRNDARSLLCNDYCTCTYGFSKVKYCEINNEIILTDIFAFWTVVLFIFFNSELSDECILTLRWYRICSILCVVCVMCVTCTLFMAFKLIFNFRGDLWWKSGLLSSFGWLKLKILSRAYIWQKKFGLTYLELLPNHLSKYTIFYII